ncbi:MAG: type II toxin-antitoxin system VapC family toxin [Oscillospiraceae bacterium]
MKVLIDTNVILDVLCGRAEFLEASSKVWKYCEVDKLTGVISALSVPNIVYILRKELDPDKTKEIIDRLLLIFDVVELTAEDLRKAAEMKTADYEDAVQMCCAERINADFIVTRNIRDFVSSPVPAVKPSELLDRI